MRDLDGTAAVCVKASSLSAKAGHWETGKVKYEVPGACPIKRESEDLHYCCAAWRSCLLCVIYARKVRNHRNTAVAKRLPQLFCLTVWKSRREHLQMKQLYKWTASLTAVLFILAGSSFGVNAVEKTDIEDALTDTAAYVYDTVSDPQVGSIGGEWTVIGLSRSGYSVPDEYYQNYYNHVVDYVEACDGILHDKKYTEYSRVILALTAIGKDPSNVGGYNLLTALGDYDKTVWQGVNGPAWALLALDSGSYAIPQNPDAQTQATRELYIDAILQSQLPDGGWSLGGDTADPDITGMALQALAKYQDKAGVQQAIEKALGCMSKRQNENGGFTSWGEENSEGCIQMLIALCELELPLDDARFVKNGNTILDNVMTYYQQGNGFLHTYSGSGSGLMASEQGLCGLAAVKRMLDGESSLYRMDDHIAVDPSEPTEPGEGLPGKHADVKKTELQYPGKTFADINGHTSQAAIEALAARGVISGMTDETFAPDETMTRAEFAIIVVRGLGLPETAETNVFADVSDTAWFCAYVNAAYAYGIVNGVSDTEFAPENTITREEAAVMVTRAARLCGMDTEMDATAVRDILAGFTDYVTASDWAAAPLAFCYEKGILSDEKIEIMPQKPITRAEIAQMLYNLLDGAKLL